jgi:hypothetical protein
MRHRCRLLLKQAYLRSYTEVMSQTTSQNQTRQTFRLDTLKFIEYLC